MASTLPDLLEIICEPRLAMNWPRQTDPRRPFAHSLVNEYIKHCTIYHRPLWSNYLRTGLLTKRSRVRIPPAIFFFFYFLDVDENILQLYNKWDFENNKRWSFIILPHARCLAKFFSRHRNFTRYLHFAITVMQIYWQKKTEFILKRLAEVLLFTTSFCNGSDLKYPKDTGTVSLIFRSSLWCFSL